MSALKPAYLIHGDDHGAVAERRAGLRALAETGQGGAACLEVLEGDSATPAALAQALSVMTLGLGMPELGGVGRVIIVDGVERWREAEVTKHVLPAMADIPAGTTVALFAREEARASAPGALHDAVRGAGGQVVTQMTVKRWELAGWAREQAARLGLALDAAAAKALVEQVGARQQRLLRELETLALEGEEPAAAAAASAATEAVDASPAAAGEHAPAAAPAARMVDVEEVQRRAARSSEVEAYALADALLAADERLALHVYLRLREQGERPAGLTYLMARRLRDALAASVRLAGGTSAAEVRRGLRMPQRAAERFLADVERSDPERLRGALATLAQLELDSRGGAPIAARRTPTAGMTDDTLAVRAIEAITR
jgi:DNA polymerase-3 subunit delta